MQRAETGVRVVGCMMIPLRRQRHKVTGIQGMHNSRASYMPCSVSLGPVATVITLSQGHKTPEYPLKPYAPRLGRYIKP
jgi:hypothetical protein